MPTTLPHSYCVQKNRWYYFAGNVLLYSIPLAYFYSSLLLAFDVIVNYPMVVKEDHSTEDLNDPPTYSLHPYRSAIFTELLHQIFHTATFTIININSSQCCNKLMPHRFLTIFTHRRQVSLQLQSPIATVDSAAHAWALVVPLTGNHITGSLQLTFAFYPLCRTSTLIDLERRGTN